MPNQSTKISLVAEISASSNGLISALKQASGAINDTTSNWQGKFSQLKDSTSLISQSVKNLGDLVGKIGDVDMNIDVEGMEKVNADIAEVSKNFARVQGEVSAFTAQLVEMKNAASDLNMPVDEYQRFADAVKNAGMSIEEGQSAIKNMQKNILDLANGVPEAKDMFGKLGLTLETLSSNTATANFDAIVQALQSVVQPTEQAKASMELFKTSMEHAINVSQEYNKLLVEQTNNAYATDKDVQQSISLANAVEKLGVQLGAYAGKANEAASANGTAQTSFEQLFEALKKEKSVLADMYVEYANYVDALKRAVTSTLDGSRAIDVFADNAMKMGKWSDKDIGANLEQLVSFVRLAKNKIEDEMTAVVGIMNQRIMAGAPIDTKELETAQKHVEQFSEAVRNLYFELMEKDEAGLPVSQDDLTLLANMSKYLADAKSKLVELNATSFEKNLPNMLDEYGKSVESFKEKLADAQKAVRKGLDIKTDKKGLEELDKNLDELTKKLYQFLKQGHTIEGSVKLTYLNESVSKLRTGFEEVEKKSSGMAYKVRHGIRGMVDAMKEFLFASKEANGELGKTGDTTAKQVKQIAGQLFGMGSQVAIIVKGFRSIGEIIKVNVIDPLTKANEELRKMQDWQTKGQRSTAQSNYKRWEQMESDLTKYYETLLKVNKEGKNADKVDLLKQQRDLSTNYGIDINPSNADRVMRENFAASRNQRKDALESEIRALQKLNEALEAEYKERDSYLKNDLFKSPTEKARGKERMIDIRKEQGENIAQIGELQERLRRLGGEDNLGDFWRKQRATKMDESQAEKAKAQEKAEEERKKALENQKKAFDEATKKLNEWSNSLTDTDRQKNVRAIMEKYEEAVMGGVDEKEAEKVAIQAINAMLRKEREDEGKANNELLRAIEERIKAYKTAYKAYQDAEKAVVDAKKAYARTQKDLENEAKAERIAKRRERLAKKMGSFGFSPFEGFSLNESPSARRERRRNAQIDASISEKMAKAQAGGRVSWTRAEKERLSEFQKLQKKDKALEAAQKQMEAADKQKKAAEQLQEAAKAIGNAYKGVGVAIGDMLSNSLPRRVRRGERGKGSEGKSAEEIFSGAKKGLTAKGIGSAMGQRQANYNGQLETIHKDLQNLNSRVFVVR